MLAGGVVDPSSAAPSAAAPPRPPWLSSPVSPGHDLPVRAVADRVLRAMMPLSLQALTDSARAIVRGEGCRPPAPAPPSSAARRLPDPSVSRGEMRATIRGGARHLLSGTGAAALSPSTNRMVAAVWRERLTPGSGGGGVEAREGLPRRRRDGGCGGGGVVRARCQRRRRRRGTGGGGVARAEMALRGQRLSPGSRRAEAATAAAAGDATVW